MTREIRRQRQRTIIVRAAAAGDLARASALLAEHVIEFPHDHDLLDPCTSAHIAADGSNSRDGGESDRDAGQDERPASKAASRNRMGTISSTADG